MQDFLNEKGRNRTSYSCYDTLGNTRVKGELSYRKGGFQLNNSLYDYFFQITGYPVDRLKATSVEAGVLFSLEPNYTDSFAGLSIVQYSSSSSMACAYLDVSGDDSYNLTYGNSTFLPSEGWETQYNAYEKEWRFYSWHAIRFSFLMLEDVCNSAGFNI